MGGMERSTQGEPRSTGVRAARCWAAFQGREKHCKDTWRGDMSLTLPMVNALYKQL